jgi:hypothetical protein
MQRILINNNYKPNLMRLFNLFQIVQAVLKVFWPSKPSLYYKRYKNGRFSTMNISLIIRDRKVFDMPLKRAKKLNTNVTKRQIFQNVL